ncbi:MAG: TetR/AcrR family transcriptional regulator [Deltaproteobacteria bacterium]|nr:TetR/AcrR family transcriptional regulator [Deltaproteobacteria bacterium]MBW2362016.1 TetR/AcrR family transcriptional regulator [Deltaproteobacteria bacterium]
MPRRSIRPTSHRRGPGRPAGGQSGGSREALLEAAQELMAERGLPRVTVREVAERAGLQPALVNYYFGGKEELLQAVVDRAAGRLLARAAESVDSEGSPQERLRALLRSLVIGMTEEPYAPRLIVEQVLFGREEVVDEFARRFASRQFAILDSVFGEGRAAGEFRDLETHLLAPQMLGAAIFFFLAQPVLRRLFGIEEITPEYASRYADQFADVLLHGICTPREAPE